MSEVRALALSFSMPSCFRASSNNQSISDDLVSDIFENETMGSLVPYKQIFFEGTEFSFGTNNKIKMKQIENVQSHQCSLL